MKIEKIEKYLEEVSEGTDFSFTVEEEENKELTLYMQGDNPEGHDKRMNALIPQIIQSISFKKIILLPDTVLVGG